ncbi:1-acyl-sn-glycerol-3-phosphate acyltransferase [Calothrix anomala FACHB-343]|uniref:1-acyl-sn-glycerol-3-phosphate acyltransferase n=3 Tax=Calotrichaceae TaxID=2661849 RepID=A0ABR8A9H1_9CYAN|nr:MULTISPECIES: 1-acyl-sn-glycerol-3-phosphate acyltransferase [Calothrix]MBD2196309.1 1-acyl-sn-glycerol-3-phosphate acyltransferase [Calothrix parietina FACHB-288]MBD2225295.1 1-acyl-sn-glycerol-3-phosphate acyltransferase [Calothrix anomala FACHB-343]
MMDIHSATPTSEQKLANTRSHNQVANTTSDTSRVSAWLAPLAYLLGRYFLIPSFFGHIQIIGEENIPETGPMILAPTHRARWDALLVPYAAIACHRKNDLRFMVTSSECKGLQGWFVRRLGGFPVDPKHPSITTLRHGVDLLQQKKTLVIFPEGGIYRDGEVHPLKPGIARLALSAEASQPDLGVKIIPISINYSQSYPNWGTDVIIHIGSPITVADYNHGSLKQNAKSLTSDLTKVLQQLSHQETEIPNHTFAEIPNL